MANLSITLQCNRVCSYCFARTNVTHGDASGLMTRETFCQTLGLLKRSRIGQLRLLGGEPTLHPEFSSFVEKGRAESFNVLVFSNGLISENALRVLERYEQDGLGLLVNVNGPAEQSPEETAWQARTFARLGARVGLGHNIHKADTDLSFLFDLVETYGLRRQIRLGLAHPCLGFGNTYLHPKHYHFVGLRISEFMLEAETRNILVDLDCGFVPCMFPQEFLKGRPALDKIGNRCNPMPDLLPDGTWIPCYPLSEVWRLNLSEVEDTRVAQDTFVHSAASYRQIGIYPHCADCEWRQAGQCIGGCLSAAMRRLRPRWKPLQAPIRMASRVTVPLQQGTMSRENASKLWHIPYIDQPLSFWAALHEDYGQYIQCVYVPLPTEYGIGSGRPLQPATHLKSFLQSGPFCISILVNPVTLPVPAKDLAPRILEGLKELCGQYNVRDVTVSNLEIARYIRERFPAIRLAASVLMDIATPHQVHAWSEVFDVIVPSNRIMRQRALLQALKTAFSGRIRLIVNESCIPGCPHRVQHFYEMGSGLQQPQSLCEPTLCERPWLRLTGAWVLPQHLHLYDGLYDELKLAGRITLQDPHRYRQVLGAYIQRQPLAPHEIGGGPASVLNSFEISEAFYVRTMECGLQCHVCSLCREYHSQQLKQCETARHDSLPPSDVQLQGAFASPRAVDCPGD